MSINSDSNIEAGLQIGPTTQGMVRIYIESDGISLPLDFEPEEAEEIAEEIRAAAERARHVGSPTTGRSKSGRSKSGQPGSRWKT